MSFETERKNEACQHCMIRLHIQVVFCMSTVHCEKNKIIFSKKYGDMISVRKEQRKL